MSDSTFTVMTSGSGGPVDPPRRALTLGRIAFAWVLVGGIIGFGALASGANSTSEPPTQELAVDENGGSDDAPAPTPLVVPAAQTAAADDTCYTETASYSAIVEAGGNSTTLTVAGFDTSLGTLTSVSATGQVGLSLSGNFTPEAALTEPSSLTASASYNVTIGSHDDSLVASDAKFGEDLGVLAADVAPGETAPFSATAVLLETTATNPDPSNYMGGTLDYPVTVFAALSYFGGGNKVIEDVVNATAEVAVTYCYTPAAEPSALTIVKTVEAGTGTEIPTFQFSIACSDGSSHSATIDGAGSVEVDLGVIADGTTCTVTEVFEGSESNRWAVEVGGACGQTATGVEPDGTVTFNNRLWDTYDVCSPAS